MTLLQEPILVEESPVVDRAPVVDPVEVPEVEVPEVENPFTAAADVLKQYGWIQKNYGTERWGFCLVGALQEVNQVKLFGATTDFESLTENIRLLQDDIAFLTDQIRRRPGCQRVSSIQRWNDVPWRRKGTVLRLLRRTARRWERAHR